GSWSYVIRVPDPATGVSKPRWVGGFATEEDAKAARDEARVRARRGEYVNRSTSTVAAYLAEWVEAHASTPKPKTLRGYRHGIHQHIRPPQRGLRLEGPGPGLPPKPFPRFARAGRQGRHAISRHDRFPHPPPPVQGVSGRRAGRTDPRHHPRRSIETPP